MLFVLLPQWAAAQVEPITPLPAAAAASPEKVALGERLFNDKRLSHDDTVSCASCHDLASAGNDGRSVARGIGGATGKRNAPTVFNAVFNFRQFWDGRASSLDDQMDAPLTDPREMGSSWAEVVGKLSADAAFSAGFGKVYPAGISEATLKDAIVAFEQSLTTPNSRFDLFLRGDRGAISEQERRGYELFKQYGCVACHQGINVGGNMFQVFGVMADLGAHRESNLAADLGRYAITGDDADRHVFKVPSLRNVAVTAPYFHDGSAATLADAVDVMFTYQLGRTVPHEDKALIIDFLQTLTGEYRGHRLTSNPNAAK